LQVVVKKNNIESSQEIWTSFEPKFELSQKISIGLKLGFQTIKLNHKALMEF
jgi:hypothetical protein